MGSQAAGGAQPSGRTDHPNHRDESRRLTTTCGVDPNLAATNSAMAAAAAATAAVAKSDTAKTDGRLPVSEMRTFAAISDEIPRSREIVVRIRCVRVSSSDEFRPRGSLNFEESRLIACCSQVIAKPNIVI